LYYCLLTDATSKRLNEYFTGGGIQHFTGKSLSKYAIPLPPLAEQERIVANLEKLMKFCDELEANIRQGIANADQLLQTALKEALEPKET
jgi:type I restriction enzyme S subunit